MTRTEMIRQGKVFEFIEAEVVVVGTGAAGYNAAACLKRCGAGDVVMVTEGICCGTSRNTGSDKQTYYKLSLAGDIPDSVRALAEVLYSGQCVDGDLALCEAALSAQSFYRLVGLGVPFPQNRFGEYIGYKTDHDPGKRATSAGPYTSRMMTEALEKDVISLEIPILDKLQVIRILVNGGSCYGLLCLDTSQTEAAYTVISAAAVIYATGGPAGIYRDSVYPLSQYGASGLAFEAGVKGKNLTEWQYGMASLSPRWNVSGTYMQVIPRFVSTDADGSDEREFLLDSFEDKGKMMTYVFLKGYQWPFDIDKVKDGSSVIDLLVYRECFEKGRRVFLDYRSNPGGGTVDFDNLSEEARTYLEEAGACFGTPFERLMQMNAPAVSYYRDQNVDLETQMLEIAVCAQHNNGGLSTDCWWHTDVNGLFAVGEVCGSHGVRRPGGSALNAGQAGSARAALYGAIHCDHAKVWDAATAEILWKQIDERITMGEASLNADGADTLSGLWQEAVAEMSRCGGIIRNSTEIKARLVVIRRLIEHFSDVVKISHKVNLAQVYRFYDILLSQYMYLSAILDYIARGGKSRGSALYSDENGALPEQGFLEMFRFRLDGGEHGTQIQEISLDHMKASCIWRPVRPIPEENDFFECVWKTYLETKNVPFRTECARPEGMH